MEKDDKGSTLIRIGVSGESSFWYRPTRVVPDQRPLNGRRCSDVSVVMTAIILLEFLIDQNTSDGTIFKRLID